MILRSLNIQDENMMPYQMKHLKGAMYRTSQHVLNE